MPLLFLIVAFLVLLGIARFSNDIGWLGFGTLLILGLISFLTGAIEGALWLPSACFLVLNVFLLFKCGIASAKVG